MTLDEIAAHIEIRQVLYRYCRGVDRGDEAMLRSVYHPDATDDHGTWKGRGEDFAAYIVGAMDPQSPGSQHHITNVLVELDGDAANVESYFLALHPYQSPASSAEKTAFVGGRYLDRFELRNGSWRIAARQVVLDWTRAELAGDSWQAEAAFAGPGRRDADPSADLFP